MSQERSEAIVLRGVDFSETSRIVTFLTPGRGRLACLAKGARRPKSAFAAALDTFNRIELVYYWKEGRSVQNLAEASVLDGFAAIKADLEKAAFGAFALEVAGRVAHENEPSENLYSVLLHGLEALRRWDGSVRAHAAWQVLQLLSVAGFEPTVDVCVECGAAVTAARGFSYSGGVTCAGCRADVRLAPEDAAALRDAVAARGACPPGAERLYGMVHRYAARQLECDLRTIRVIDQMFTGTA